MVYESFESASLLVLNDGIYISWWRLISYGFWLLGLKILHIIVRVHFGSIQRGKDLIRWWLKGLSCCRSSWVSAAAAG